MWDLVVLVPEHCLSFYCAIDMCVCVCVCACACVCVCVKLTVSFYSVTTAVELKKQPAFTFSVNI